MNHPQFTPRHELILMLQNLREECIAFEDEAFHIVNDLKEQEGESIPRLKPHQWATLDTRLNELARRLAQVNECFYDKRKVK